MSLDVRWLVWEESSKKVTNYAKDSPTEIPKINSEIFVGDPSMQTPTIFNSKAEPAACEWSAGRWLADHCTVRDRLWWGVTVLHRAYCAWCDQEGQEVAAGLDAFRGVLLAKGFTITRNDMVCGLVPTKDFLTLDADLRVSYVQG